MESTAVNEKEEEDTVRVIATVAAIKVANTIAVSDAFDPPIKLDKEMIMTTDDVEHVVSKLAVVSNETATTVNATSNDPGVKEDQLNKAMASATISAIELAEHAEPVVPMPIDDDTNVPQYIPRHGSFYQHDVRMAYSTTSSQGSESDNGYERDSGNEVSDCHRIKRRQMGIKKQKSVTPVYTEENTDLVVGDGTLSTKKVLAIFKVAATIKDSDTSLTADGLAKKLRVGSRKSRDLDALDKWTHDMYDENEQTRKSRDEIMATYGYDIREESEAPRARHHYKYGRAANTNYTRSWQDTRAYTGGAGGKHSMKVKRRGMARRNFSGPKTAKISDSTKKSERNTSNESPAVVEVTGQNREQQKKTLSVQNEDKKSVDSVVETRHHTPSSRATSKYNTTSPTNRDNHHHQQNGGPSTPSSSKNINNYFKRPSIESPISKEKGAQVHAPANSNFFTRRPQQNSGAHIQHHNKKQQHYSNGQSGQGHNQQHRISSPSVSRGRNFRQHQTLQQYNRDGYFSKRSIPLSSSSSNQQNYDQQHYSAAPTTALTSRTQHGCVHYQNYSNRQYENENQQIEPPPPPTPVVRSSKRYSVQSRRELPDPVFNIGGISKTPQSQPSAPQQQNGLIMQDQQMQPAPQQIQQQQPIFQIYQQPLPLQSQQFHQFLQQIHHGMVHDHNTRMMVMAAADPSMYRHQMYATPQYDAGVAAGPVAGSAQDQNAAPATQAAVYQPVLTGATGVSSPPFSTQSLQPPETFMTTYYQPQQQSNSRHVNPFINNNGIRKANLFPTSSPTYNSFHN